MRNPNVNVTINLDAVRAAAENVRRRTGVGLIAVIKADAYGLGAARVADVLAPVVDEFAFFTPQEARELGRSGLVLGPPTDDPAVYRELNLRPAIANRADAARFGKWPVAIKVDTQMQRFGCPPEELDDLAARCNVVDYFCHAVSVNAAQRLRIACDHRGRPMHAAATCLLDEPAVHFDAVRPGLALYRGAVRVTTKLHSVRHTSGPVGYTGFEHSPVGIILAGYSNGLRPGPVVVNGRPQRLLEVGMNTAFLTVDAEDRAGDSVVLLGHELPEATIASHAGVREHEVLCNYTAMGVRQYMCDGPAEPTDSLCTTRSIAAAPPRT